MGRERSTQPRGDSREARRSEASGRNRRLRASTTEGCYSPARVSIPGATALVVVWASLGPPTLPPLPGERPPTPPPSDPAEPGDPAKPTRPSGPAPQKPSATQVEPTAPTPQAPAPSAPGPTPVRPTVPLGARPAAPIGLPTAPSPESPASPAPAVIEPPPGPAPGTPPPPATAGERTVARGGVGAEPLPGSDADERPALRLPPPRRPPYSGLGLFIGSGVTFSLALSEQIVSHVLIKRRCIEPFAAQAGIDATTPEEAEQEARGFEHALIQCAPGVLPAVVLRVQSDLSLMATIGLATAGAVVRAQRRAYDDVFADRPATRMLGLRAAGLGLLGTGVITWLTTGALSWGLLASCRDAKCATRARLMAFTTRDAGVVLITAGAGMLTYAVAHGRAYDRVFRDRALSVGTAWVPGGAGLSLAGRF